VLGRVDVDVDDLGLGGEGVDPAGDPVVEAAAQGDQQVATLHGGDRGVVAVHAGHAQAQGVRVGEASPGHQGGDHRDAGALGQLPERVGGPGLQDPAAGVDDRALGGQQQLRRPSRRVALGHRVVAGQVEVLTGSGQYHSIMDWRCPWDVDQDRAGTAGGGHVEGLGHHPGDVVGTSVISQLCLVIPMVMPVMSLSWKASVPMAVVATWPVTTTSGIESM
jgi:hypothetical protein